MARNTSSSPAPTTRSNFSSSNQFSSFPQQQQQQRTRISTTQTVTVAPTSTTTQPTVLRLRADAAEGMVGGSGRTEQEQGRRIQWAEGTVDNEGLGRKKSKVCCIYHAPRTNIDDSSSESSSSSDSSSDESGDDDSARPVGGKRGRGSGKGHKHGKDCDHGKGKGGRKPSPNAYEKMPKYKPRGDPGAGGSGMVR